MAYKGQPTAKSLKMEMGANKMFGAPAAPKKMAKKMTPKQIATRKRSMISNAATKAMSSQYSK